MNRPTLVFPFLKNFWANFFPAWSRGTHHTCTLPTSLTSQKKKKIFGGGGGVTPQNPKPSQKTNNVFQKPGGGGGVKLPNPPPVYMPAHHCQTPGRLQGQSWEPSVAPGSSSWCLPRRSAPSTSSGSRGSSAVAASCPGWERRSSKLDWSIQCYVIQGCESVCEKKSEKVLKCLKTVYALFNELKPHDSFGRFVTIFLDLQKVDHTIRKHS